MPDYVYYIIYLAITFLFSFAIGFERQTIRTASSSSAHVLVSMSACALAIVQTLIFKENNGEDQRLIAALLTGMGFLGAGVIIKNGDRIKGLTTASTLWYCTITSMILGLGYLWLGLGMALFGVLYIYVRDFVRGINPFKASKENEESNKPLN